MHNITAIILAGGRATRLRGAPKGLQPLHGTPLVQQIVERLAPQCAEIRLNLNNHHAEYAQLLPQIAQFRDNNTDFLGPLAGIEAAFAQCNEADQLLFVPCDTPFLPANLVEKLTRMQRINQANIVFAHDGTYAHPSIALISRQILPALRAYLLRGGRKVMAFFAEQHAIAADFSENPRAFLNFNTPDDFQRCETGYPLPLLAISSFSGSGKTTLLEKLIPLLIAQGVRVASIKHSHHHVDVDKTGKDSWRARQAGANPTLLACDQRFALMHETPQPALFSQLIGLLDPREIDLVLVEGFKHEALPKILLHRLAHEKARPPVDSWTLAYATDYPLAESVPLLDLNNPQKIVEFILNWLKKAK